MWEFPRPDRCQKMLRMIAPLLLLAAPAFTQSTWVVDDDLGPGVNFGEIQAALFASADGDLILVRAGHYSGFVVRRAVRIIGQGAVSVDGAAQVRGVQSTLPIVVSGLHVGDFEAGACTAAVALVDSVVDGSLEVAGCTDYRAAGVTVRGSSVVRVSRAEFVNCDLRGAAGAPAGGACDDGGSGATAVTVEQSFVHLALTEVAGGAGAFGAGTGCLTTCNGLGGWGGDGIRGRDSVLVLAGDGTQVVEGGPGGWSSCSTFNGSPGKAAVLVGCDLRYSGVDFVGPAGHGLVASTTTITTPAMDPTLELVGVPGPGGLVSAVVRGDPGRVRTARAWSCAGVVRRPRLSDRAAGHARQGSLTGPAARERSNGGSPRASSCLPRRDDALAPGFRRRRQQRPGTVGQLRAADRALKHAHRSGWAVVVQGVPAVRWRSTARRAAKGAAAERTIVVRAVRIALRASAPSPQLGKVVSSRPCADLPRRWPLAPTTPSSSSSTSTAPSSPRRSASTPRRARRSTQRARPTSSS